MTSKRGELFLQDHEQNSSWPEYENYCYPQSRPAKKRTGLLVVLVMVALITGAVSWVVNVLDVDVKIDKNSASLTIGEQETEMPLPAVMAEVPSYETAQVKNEFAGLVVEESPKSVENRPAEDDRALSLQQIYEKVSPSVASISCILRNGSGTGTGIVMSEDGYVITNYHVIENAQRIDVLLGKNVSYTARLVGGDETTDIAVLKVDAIGLNPAEFGDSDALRVGDAVVAIGDPLGAELRGTMTDGIVSAINRDLNLSGRKMTLIQTNAALNSGNSGGPLINCYGQVIGINTMKMSNYSPTSTTVEGLGFAIPIAAAKPIIDELVVQGYVSGRPAIGIRGQSLDLRAQLFYHLPSGIIITEILPDSNAAQMGLKTDDVIVAFNGVSISSLEDLVRIKSDCTAGDSVQLTVYRGASYYQVTVELMDQISPDIY